MKIRYTSIGITATLIVTALSSAQSTAVCWGWNDYGQCNVPSYLGDVVAIDGLYHSVALLSDGSVMCWGYNSNGQCNAPSNLPPITAISTGVVHTLALDSTGHVFAWGSDEFFKCSGPSSVQGVRSIAAANYGSVVALQNGTVRGWGSSYYYDPPANLTDVVQVAADDIHAGALRSDGTVVCWGVRGGPFDYGQSSVPAGLQGVTKLAMGAYHSLAIRSDRTLCVWGSNSHGQRDVPSGELFTEADGGDFFSIGLTTDGRALCWGDNAEGQLNIPVQAHSGVLHVNAGGKHAMALLGPPVSITSVRPVSAPATGGSVVTISGNNFRSISRVWFGSIESPAVEVLSNNSIRATVPANRPGEVDLRVDYGSSVGFYYRPECGSDLDQDGEVSAADIAIVLLDFGPCYQAPLAAPAPEVPPLLDAQTPPDAPRHR